MVIGIIFLILIFVMIIYYIMSLRTPDYYKGPVSDHFDGKNFYNPGSTFKKKSTFDLFRWWISRERVAWPKHVENTPPNPIISNMPSHQLRVTFINHSTVLLQTEKINILTDPVWAERVSPFSFIGPVRVRKPGINFDELPKIDLVLISHNHYDHLDLSTLLKLNKQFNPLIIVPLGNKVFLERYQIDNVMEMDWWEQYHFKSAIITFLPAKHWSSRWLNDKLRTLWGSFGIEIENQKIYFAGDTGFSSDILMQIHSQWGTPDVALLPIGSYKPEWFMKESHMNPAESVEAHRLLHAKHSIPIHYGTFQLSDEGINEPVEGLKKALIENQISLQDFLPLSEGENRDFIFPSSGF